MDWQAVGVGVSAVLTAVATLIGGIYTGRSGASKDRKERADARELLEQTRLARDQAEETASKQRVEALAEDLSFTRKRVREIENDYHELRQQSQRGWDLASYHFGLVSVLSHALNNIFTAFDYADSEPTVAQFMNVVRNAKVRMRSVVIPNSLEEHTEQQIRK